MTDITASRERTQAVDRRQFLGAIATFLGARNAWGAPLDRSYRLTTFSAEVSPPLGHALMGGGIAPAQKIVDPLFARGFVLLGAGKPIVLAAIDWCEIRNDAYERWRNVLAEAAGTDPARVIVTSLHQHDTPIADLTAQRILDEHRASGSVCDLAFHERAVQNVAKAVRSSLGQAGPITHYGVGQAKVDKVASNRRYVAPDGKPAFNRMSATRDPAIRDQPEGVIDPWLKTLSFWYEDRPVLALSCYATHPMSYYGRGGVSADFIGQARRRRQEDEPGVFQIYTSGCSGNVTAGKYNDGDSANRQVLADRIYTAMAAAWKATVRTPLSDIDYRTIPLRLEPRTTDGYSVEDLQKRLTTDPKPFGQCLAALGLSWHRRVAAGSPIDVPVLDLGNAQILLLPGESYVEYQLAAQQVRPEKFVLTMGYGESATGYIPTDKHFEEHDTNLSDWCWVAPGSEARMKRAIREALLGSQGAR